MLVYTATKGQFCEDVQNNRIDTEVLAVFERRLGHSMGESESRAIRNSLMYMQTAVQGAKIPDDAGVAIEYRIPQTSKRIDFILSGYDDAGRSTAVIVELKQWSEAGLTTKDAIVETFLGGRWRETQHPSYQAWTYAQLLRDYNETVYTEKIALLPCAYLHNCKDGEVLRGPHYARHVEHAPLFLRDDAAKLMEFLNRHVRKGDRRKVIYQIEHGRIRPSKELADHLGSLLKGNQEFLMIDDQKLVYETALEMAANATLDGKAVLIVEGGPGTGKSVVANHLLVELTKRDSVACYVTRTQAPRDVYESKLSQSMQKSRITNLFKGSNSFYSIEANAYDALIIDEAHRLTAKSGLFKKGENQVKELIAASSFTVFFVDERQRVTFNDIGSKDEIRLRAELINAKVVELEPESQFRCNGSDGYIAWLDNTLQIRETANETLDDIAYEFEICKTPAELRDRIFELNAERNKSRLVAGYCWDWACKKKPTAMDIIFPEHGFAMKWNLTDDGMLWLIKPDSVDQVGCIHTCQGLELDYVGVILGKDLVVREGIVRTDAGERSSQDRSVAGYKKMLKEHPIEARRLADEVIKNTYRVLMTRGQKGCFIWSVDPETNEWFQERLGKWSTNSTEWPVIIRD